jgi:hypothetical protein
VKPIAFALNVALVRKELVGPFGPGLPMKALSQDGRLEQLASADSRSTRRSPPKSAGLDTRLRRA